MSNTVCIFSVGNDRLTMDGKALTAIPYKMTKIDGFSASDYEVTISANGQNHGGRVMGKRVCERPITIEGRYRGSGDVGEAEERLIGFFNPTLTGTLTVTHNDLTRMIDYEVSSFETKRSGGGAPLSFQLSLVCPKPFFLDVEEFSENMANKIALIHAALVIPVSGLAASYKEFKQEMRIHNAGHKSAGLKIEIMARGDVTNPRLDNLTTGEYIALNTTMSAGDVLVVNTRKGETDVTLNGASITQHKDRGSRYFQMVAGDNILKYNADSGYTNMDVYPRYRPEYLGV